MMDESIAPHNRPNQPIRQGEINLAIFVGVLLPGNAQREDLPKRSWGKADLMIGWTFNPFPDIGIGL